MASAPMLKLVDRQDHSALKEFSVTMMWVFPLVFMLFLPWLFDSSIPWWPAALSAVLAILYFVFPSGLYVPYRIWMAIAMVLGWINTRLILALAFYLMILPIGLLLKVFNKLQYQQQPKDNASYWIKSESPKSKDNLKEPF
jgi:uncharacterized membrane protein YkvA (DUF1232 family)